MAEYNLNTVFIETWTEIPIERPSGKGRSAEFNCPSCGQILALINHSVLSSGQVVPSVKCPNCEFHNDIKLEGWQ